jgi:hypothetical protein
MTTIDEREEARYRQDVLRSYRAWRAYLDAQQTIVSLAGEAQATIDPFEGANASQERADTARQRIEALPTAQRDLFNAVFDQERTRVQQQLDGEAHTRGGTVRRADPDDVARQALTRLIEEAQGLHRDDRRGLVPRGKPDAVKWLAIDLTEIEHAPPSETDYQLAGAGRVDRRGMITNIVFAVLALMAIPIVIVLLRPGGQAPLPDPGARSGGTDLTPWDIVAIRDETNTWTIPVVSGPSDWTGACADARRHTAACRVEGSFNPIRICLPADRLNELTTLLLDAPAGLPTRSFAISETPRAQPDLLISPCDRNAPASSLRYGTFRDVTEPIFLKPGEHAPDGLQVTAITLRGRGMDPSLPEGQANLIVQVAEDTERDWTALAPTILLMDGTEALPGATRREADQITLEYLIPEPIGRTDLVWQIAPGNSQIVRYRTTLEPPPSRDTVLRTSLEIVKLATRPARQTMQVQLTLRNTSTNPLMLVPAELSFQTQTGLIAAPADNLQQPLAPDEARSVTIDLPLQSGVLQIGPYRYQLTVTR